ncbi:MAG: cob(I)yrinic acid a,c-diamide adenosyltransferase [Phycisphaerae bacterium]|jgi:cob(I)alamin adenosyltransferase
MTEKGLVQIYTGNGKGKTTAAFGLAVRAAGWGKKVVIYQFLKPPSVETGERKAIAKSNLPIEILPIDAEWDMRKSFDDKAAVENTRNKIAEACEKIAEQAKQKKYDIIILDEIIFCVSKKLAQLEWVKNIIESKDSSVEIVLTGRGATKEMNEMADLVTEMKEIKHPYNKNVAGRKGIEF